MAKSESGKGQPLIAIVYGWGLTALKHRNGVETIDVDTIEEARIALPSIDGIVLCGGGDVNPKRYASQRHPEVYGVDKGRDDLEFFVVEEARKRGIPMMGICRGSQILNIAYGGSLHQDIKYMTEVKHWGTLEEIRLQPKSAIARTVGLKRFKASHYHHQAVDRIGFGLWPAAWSRDGIVEAIESLPGTAPYVLGTQFHPEMDWPKAEAEGIFKHFIKECSKRANRRRKPSFDRAVAYLQATDAATSARDTDNWWDDDDEYTSEGWNYSVGNVTKLTTDTATRRLEEDWDLLDGVDSYAYCDPEPKRPSTGYQHAMDCDMVCAFPPCKDPTACDPDMRECLSEAIAFGFVAPKRGSKR